MKSVFSSSWFGPQGFSDYSPPQNGVWLGQAAAAPDQGDIAGLTSGIQSFLSQLPPELLGQYNTKYQQCQNQISNGGLIGLATGGKCMYDLWKELDALFKHGPPKPPALPPPAAEFPILPVAVGAVGLVVLIWGLTKL
jgi:hypothetical protein